MISGFPRFRKLRLTRVALSSRMKYMSFLGWHSRFPICDLCGCECTGSVLRSSKRSTRIVAHPPRLKISSSISVSRKQTVSPQDLAIIAPSQGGALELYDDMVMRAIEFAKQMPNPTLKVFRILCHKHPWLETVAKDCITRTKIILMMMVNGTGTMMGGRIQMMRRFLVRNSRQRIAVAMSTAKLLAEKMGVLYIQAVLVPDRYIRPGLMLISAAMIP